METHTDQHIDHALIAKTHPPMYLMHKYWARKPHNIVRQYIEKYSKEGEIVLDPFVGSGVTAIEAIRIGRKAVAIDLDPMGIFITQMTALSVDLKNFEAAFIKIKKKVKPQIDKLWQTICPECKGKAVSTHVIWKKVNDKEEPVEIFYRCLKCNDKQLKIRKVEDDDVKKLQKIEQKPIPFWHPTNELIWNTRVNVHKGMRVSDLFTKRNLIGLSILLNAIENLSDNSVKELMKFTFTSALGQASKLVFIIEKRGRQKGQIKHTKEVGSWATRGYWIPPKHFEVNAWNCFEERFKKVYRGKVESSNEIKFYKEAASFEGLKDEANILIKTHNALELSKILPENSVDYVFTDLPYGDSVPYLELDYMWSSWLKFHVNFDDEIIISDSPVRKEKNFEIYHKMMCAAFREIYRALKPSKWLTVTFHNTDIRIYNSIISAVILAGFELEKIVYQPPARPSPKGLLAPYGSAIGDYYIRFRKPEKVRELLSLQEIDRERYEKIIVESIKRIIAERGEPTPYSVIVNSYSLIYDELKKNGFLFSAPQTVEEILKNRLNKEFTLRDSKWWFKDPSTVPFIERVPLNERVEKSVVNILNRLVKASFDDVLKEIFINFPNALTPDAHSVREFLETYAKQTREGKWILKPSFIQRQNEHNRVCEILSMIGEKIGLNVYADLPQWRTNFPHLSLPKENIDRIKEIDVIWYADNQIICEFEVENTTGITEAIIRGSNIPNEVKRLIVIPGERKKLLAKKVTEPALKERIEQDKWQLIYYDELFTFFDKIKRKKSLSLDEFGELVKSPMFSKEEDQEKLSSFF